MTTVGGTLPPEPAPLGLPALPIDPKRSTRPCCEPPARPDGWLAPPWSPPWTEFGGSGLLRRSLRVDVEDEGVRTGDWLESRDEGDEVPSLESLFFLEDFVASLPRES